MVKMLSYQDSPDGIEWFILEVRGYWASIIKNPQSKFHNWSAPMYELFDYLLNSNFYTWPYMISFFQNFFMLYVFGG